jgi:hypothetical protein
MASATEKGRMTTLLDTCPVCDAGQTDHTPETENDWEWWEFECGAEIIRCKDMLEAERPCDRALAAALDRINAKRIVANT